MSIYCTVGTTGSGKSTWARNQKGIFYISDDALWEMSNHGTYWFDECISLHMRDGVLDLAQAVPGDVIIDSAHWFLNDFDRLASEIRVTCKPITWVVFPLPGEKEYRKRISKLLFNGTYRGLTLDQWVKIYLKHEASYKPPTGSNIIYPEK